jgi:hypothetical protein
MLQIGARHVGNLAQLHIVLRHDHAFAATL